MIQSIYHFHSKEGINMNKIYKVIWSKAKHTYVVASEIAKGHTKGETTGRGLKKLAAALLVAAALMGPNYAWAADTTEVKPVSGEPATVEVYTKDGADNTFVKKGSDTALHISRSGDLIVGTKENQTVKDMEIRGKLTSGSISTGDITSTGDVTVKGKMAADGVTDDTTKDGTYIKQNNTVGNNLVSLDTQAKANADAIAEKANATDVYTKAETDQKVDAANTYTYRKVAAEEKAREAADTELNERITNEANEIHKTTNQLQSDLATETADRKAADEALDSRSKALEDKTEAITYDKDSKTVMVEGKLTATEGITDGTTKDGQYVKADHYVGQNLNALDQGLQAETAARQAADTTLQTNIDNEAAERKAADTVLDDKITAETSARVAADTKLVEAVNSGLSLSNDNVLQKNTTTIDAQGNVTTSKTNANEMILNKGKDNQITLNENGIKVGTNSTVVDKDGVYTGGDTYAAAKAAMSADGKIKGANGKFTVDASGNTTVTSLDAGTGTIQTKGDIYAKDATFSGDITAKDATLSGDLSAKDGTFSGDLSAKDGTFSGDVSAKDVTATGTLQGAEVTDGTATMKNGNITGVKNLSAETITTSGNADIGGDLTVKGKLNVDEIDLTKNGIDGDYNVISSTKVSAGEITSYKKATSTKDGSEKESAIDYDENGTSTWAKATDADGNWKKSTLTVEGNDVTSKVIDSEKNSNLSTQTSTQSQSTLTDKDKNTNVSTQTVSESSSVVSGKDGEKTYKSYITQNMKKILQGIEDGDGNVLTSTEQTETDITNTAKNGTITNDAGKLVNTASGTIANMAGNDITNTSTNGNIANTAANGTISNNAKNLTNTASENITNKAENGNISNIASNGTISNEAKTISNKATEALTNDAKTITNKASESVTTQIGDGSEVQSVMNGGGIANKATGKSITNDAAKITNTGTTSVTNQVGNNKVLVDTTHVQSAFGNTIYTTWDESGITNNATDKTVATNAKNIQNTATGDITNTAEKGTITNKAQNLVNDASGNMTTTVGGEMKTTVTGKVTEDYKSDLDTKVGGNQTTTVTGDSSLSAKNITNKAEGGTIYNKSKGILNEASGDILNFADGEIGNSATKITNLTGDNTVTSDTNGTTFENKAHSTAVKEGSVTKTTISGNTLETGKATMDYAEVMKDLGVRGNAVVDGTLEVGGKSTFKDDVTMEKNLHVKGTTTTDKLVVDNGATIKGGATVTGGTTTDTLHVTSTSTFDGKATFKDIVTMEKDLSVGGNATVAGDVTANSYKVGDKTYIDKDGINANNQVIRNVGQGNITEGSTDAVSGGQLYETNTRVSGLETRMGTVETKVDKLDNKIDKVGANAAAMANLHPLEFDEDSKWNVAAAVGSSGSETASAVGVFYRPNENVMVNASAAMGTGENMFGGGVSLRLGHGGNKAKEAQMKAAAAENKELRAKVDDLTARMDALLSVLNPNMSKDFPDVPENHWAYEAVSRLAGNGIVEGYEDGKYHGERQMTRYEMAEIIYNALSKGAKAEKKLVEEFRPELQAMAAQKRA